MVTSITRIEGQGVTPRVAAALDLFERRVADLYGTRLIKLVLFGSRARGDAGQDSDVDVAVILDAIESRADERNRLADAAYDAIVEYSEEIQPWPITRAEWLDPSSHRNPSLVRAIQQDGLELGTTSDPRVSDQSLSLR